MSKFLSASLAVPVVVLLLPAAAADAQAGVGVFRNCQGPHAMREGAMHSCAQFQELIRHLPGNAERFKSSVATIWAGESRLVWSNETLATFPANQGDAVEGSKSAFARPEPEAAIVNALAYQAFPAAAEAAAAEPNAAAPARQTAQAGAAAEAAEPSPPPGRAAGKGGLVTGLGRVATEEEIAAWDIDVRPDGLGLPDGHGTVAEGQVLFDENCASCHGDFGEGIDRWPVLAGGEGTLTDERPNKTIGSYWPYLSTVYDYVRRAMPFGNARSMSDDEVYALTAYLLYLNDIVTEEDFELSKETFSSIAMPNADNFIDDDRLQEPHYAQTGEPCMADCLPGEATVSMHAAVLDVTPDEAADEEAPAAGIE